MTAEEAGKEVAVALNALAPLFVPEAQLTFIMRVPGAPDSHMIISNDDLGELAQILGDELIPPACTCRGNTTVDCAFCGPGESIP